MDRRKFLGNAGMATLLGAAGAALWTPPDAFALGLPKDRIKRIRYYKTPTDAAGRPNVHQPTFNQSTNIVTIETESGLTGIGEGGEPSTMEQCAGLLIGEDPFRTEHLWQVMERGYFYPAGREKTHSLGALDVALWDLKGKALGVPVWQLLGGKSRDHVECYATGYPTPPGGTIEDAARACIQAGFRAFRTGVAESQEFDRFRAVEKTIEECQLIRKGVGKDGAWAIDFHGTMDPEDAITLATAIEPLRPFFCEDLIRGENIDIYKVMRPRLRVPIAVGEIYGVKWEIAPLIEQNLIDFARCTVPNVGGITEYMKIAALAETHYCGLIPHFTGPIGETALVHCLTATSVIALMEMTGAGRRPWPYLPEAYDFHDGKLWPNERPGLGVTLDTSKLQQVGDWTEHYAPIQINHRPDGSYTNW
ncbi:MAG TPA: mandelate racemase/muconate lactonizing enzyme family protein [Rhizomicrobium sp.]|jgi:L-alanine-DL-glutamate epimerase-like enolase superfamily enzyme|nr:mandelate racemase/muconate lactonizing enzyme family protein [Rhizomicrobium sp.]